MPLTEHEKKRFADWLRSDAYANRILSQQLGKSPTLTQEMCIRFQIVADAEELVASVLTDAEEDTTTCC